MRSGSLTPNTILKSVVLHYNFGAKDLRSGKKGERELVLARRALVFLLRRHLLMPFQEIGKFISCEHTQIMHHAALAVGEMEKGGEFQKNIEQIETLMGVEDGKSSQSGICIRAPRSEEVELVLRLPRGVAINVVGHAE